MATNQNPNAPVPSVSYPTDYTIDDILLYTPTIGGALSLKDRLVELDLFEDMFNGVLTGQLVISDASGILNQSSMNGAEYIKVSITKLSQKKKIDRNFRIFSISNRTFSLNNMFETYTINFCSDELLLSEQYRLSKSYNNQSISNIIKDIFNTFLQVGNGSNKSVHIENTEGNYSFILPNKKIFETINWLSTYARPKNSSNGTGNTIGGADMIFFENTLGFFFSSLQTLYAQADVATYNFDPKNIIPKGSVSSSAQQQIYNAFDLQILDNFDTLGAISKGTFSNRLISFDPLTRKKYVTDFNYDKYNQSTNGGMNGGPITNNYQNRYGMSMFDAPPNNMETGVLRLAASNKEQVLNSEYLANNPETIAPDIHVENYVPNRVAQMALSQYQRIKITVPGNPELYVGMTITFQAFGVSAVTGKSGQRIADPQLSGKYLITAARHIITNQSYITVFELSKESNLHPYTGVNNSDSTWNSVVAGNQK